MKRKTKEKETGVYMMSFLYKKMLENDILSCDEALNNQALSEETYEKLIAKYVSVDKDFEKGLPNYVHMGSNGESYSHEIEAIRSKLELMLINYEKESILTMGGIKEKYLEDFEKCKYYIGKFSSFDIKEIKEFYAVLTATYIDIISTLGNNIDGYNVEYGYFDSDISNEAMLQNLKILTARLELLIRTDTSKIPNNIPFIKNDNVEIIKENIFIIHGHNEAKWRELYKMLKDEFKVNPIVLSEQPNQGLTIIEKFEKYAKTCSYAFAIFTPDDIVVENNGEEYFQARPNVIFELGWFYSNLGRPFVCILNQKSNKNAIFSDLQGIMRLEFNNNVSEQYSEIEKELKASKIV